MVSSAQLLKDIWGYSPDDDIETIRVHIRHLRSKIDKIEWTNVDNNKISNVKGLITGGFIQNKSGIIEKLKIDNFTNNTVSSSKNLD